MVLIHKAILIYPEIRSVRSLPLSCRPAHFIKIILRVMTVLPNRRR